VWPISDSNRGPVLCGTMRTFRRTSLPLSQSAQKPEGDFLTSIDRKTLQGFLICMLKILSDNYLCHKLLDLHKPSKWFRRCSH